MRCRRSAKGRSIFIPPGAAHAIKNVSEEPLVFVSATSPPFDLAELGAYFAYKEARRHLVLRVQAIPLRSADILPARSGTSAPSRSSS